MASTYWNGGVMVDGCIKVTMSGDTESLLLMRLMTDAIYYKAIYPESQVVMTGIRHVCGKCQNEGKTEKAMAGGRWKETKCPACKGKPPTERMADIPLQMPDPANRIKLTQG